MANGMGSLYIGTSGLKAAQTGLNATAHNLANINTEGYTRQQISYSDTLYLPVGTMKSINPANYGVGVSVSEIRRVRSQFVDSAYRAENGRLGYYSSQYNAVTEIEDLFGEMQGVTYQESLIGLRSSIQELAKEPSSTIKRSSLIEYATAFLERSDAIYNGLKSYQTTLNTAVVNMVNKINSLGNTIYDLNKKIAAVESTGVEKANDLRDKRDAALDELSGYIKIEYFEDTDTQVYVTAEGIPFVTSSCVSPMIVKTDSANGLYTPMWEAFDKNVFKDTEKILTMLDNDRGELKGLLTARGSVDVNYLDVPVKPQAKDYDLTTPQGQAEYDAALQEYQEKQDYYNDYIEPSAILSAYAGLDKLVNAIVEDINNVLCPEKTINTNTPLMNGGKELKADKYTYTTTADKLYLADGTEVAGKDIGGGNYLYESGNKLYKDAQATTPETVGSYEYYILDMDKTDYGMDGTPGEELFSRKGTERYIVIKDPATGEDMYVRNNLNELGKESLYTLGNIEMNKKAISDNGAKIPLTTKEGKEDLERAQELVRKWDNKFASLNPEQYAMSDYETFYNNFIGEYATMGKVLDNYVSHQQTMVDSYDNKRLETTGVSSDEELEKMIKFQQAYNAASRYVNVVNQMLESLITGLGR